MAEVGRLAVQVRAEVRKAATDSASWFEAYTRKDGWHLLDLAKRSLEAWVATLDDEPEEQPLAVVRRAYDDASHAMAIGFAKALAQAGWAVPGTLHQTRVWSEVVADVPRPLAYFLVDAMRFEMGVELAERLPKSSEVSLRPAVAALPSITPIGMGALMPGASDRGLVALRKAAPIAIASGHDLFDVRREINASHCTVGDTTRGQCSAR
jgi:hypothetical protein